MSAISATRPTGIRWWQAVLALIWAIAFVGGAYGLLQRFTLGHQIANYGGYIPWGLWVAMYIYFIGLSAGAFLLSSLIYVAGIQRLDRIGKLALFTAFITLVSALLTIWLDLGHQERFWEVYTRPNPFSMMAWMVWLYTCYFLLVTVELWFAVRADLIAWKRRPGLAGLLARILTFGSYDSSTAARARDRKALKVLGTLGVPLAIAFHGGVGALFGVIGARPYWNSPLYPILFLVSALASGGALLTFVVAALWPDRRSAEFKDMVGLLGRIVLALLALDLLFEWAEISINLYASIPATAGAYREMLFGPTWWVFWLVHLAIGSLVPILLLVLRPRSVGSVGLAGLLMAVTFLAVRMDIVVPGQTIPEIRGLETAYQETGLSFQYAPSGIEWLVGLFVVTFAILLFTIGYKNLPLVTEKDTEAQR
jgi:molybdopterin-containing oxidoreductase family membrane subunit